MSMQKLISSIDFLLFLLAEHPAGDDEQTSEVDAEDVADEIVLDDEVDAGKVADYSPSITCRVHEYLYIKHFSLY